MGPRRSVPWLLFLTAPWVFFLFLSRMSRKSCFFLSPPCFFSHPCFECLGSRCLICEGDPIALVLAPAAFKVVLLGVLRAFSSRFSGRVVLFRRHPPQRVGTGVTPGLSSSRIVASQFFLPDSDGRDGNASSSAPIPAVSGCFVTVLGKVFFFCSPLPSRQ